MSIRLKLKNSVVQDSTPSASDLPEVGELAVNGNINSIGGFMRASDNSIVKIFGPGSVTTPTATTTVSGISELATNSETTTGTATNRVVTPAGLNAVTVAERTTSNTNYVAKAGSTLTGVLTMPTGSNSAPAINFGDSDSGIFGGTNTVSLTAGGALGLSVLETSVRVPTKLGINGAAPQTPLDIIANGSGYAMAVRGRSADDLSQIRFTSNDYGTVFAELESDATYLATRIGGSEKLRVDSSGRLLIGHSSSVAASGNGFSLQNNGTGFADSSGLFGRYGADNNGPTFAFSKSRNATLGGQTIVQDDDELGKIRFYGSDGVDFNNFAAEIQAQVDGTPGVDDMPGRLVFKTTADGAATPTERLTIDSTGKATFTGNLTISNTQPEIFLQDSDSNSDFKIQNVNGVFKILDATSNNGRFTIASDGTATFTQNLNALSGLDVTGTTNVTGQITVSQTVPILELRSTTTTTDNCKIRFGDASSAQRASLEYDLSGTNSLKFKMGGFGNNVDRMILTGDGKLGLGTTNPTYSTELTVSDTTAYSASATNSTQHQLRINNAGLGGVAGILLTAEPSSGSAGHAGIRVISPSSGNADMTFSVRDGGTYSEKLRILSSGFVGIGTTTPNQNLMVMDTIANEPQIRIETSDGGSKRLDLFVDTSSNATLSAQQSAQDINIKARNNTVFTTGGVGAEVEAMRVKSDNDVLLTRATAGGGGNETLLISANYGSGSSQAFQASNALRFYTGGANERLRILATGEIGISTSSPAAKLHVMDGDLFLTDNSTATNSGQAVYFQSTTNGWATSDAHAAIHGLRGDSSSGYIRFDTRISGSTAEKMRLDASGRLMIGTTTEGEGDADDFTIASSGNTGITIRSGTSNDGAIFFSDGTSGNAEFEGTIQYLHSSNAMTFKSNHTERIRIDHLGKLLLGITASNDTSEMLLVASAGPGDHCGMGIKTNNNVHDGYYAFHDADASFRGSVRYDHSVDAMFFTTNGVNERMRITNGGQLLVGTSSNNSVNARVCINTDSVPSYYANPSALSVTSTNSSDSNAVEFFQGRYNKRVLTLSHAYNQSVSFTVFEQADVSVGSVTGNGSNASFNTSSDYRLKENIVNITDGITRLKQLTPRRFNWIADSTNTLIDGFIAHEVSPVIPEAVTGEKDALEEDGSIDPQQMDYSKLTPLLTAALQEAIAKIEILETKVATLEAA